MNACIQADVDSLCSNVVLNVCFGDDKEYSSFNEMYV